MKTRKYQALQFNTNQRKRGGMSYALLLLLILLAPQIVKGQAPSPWSSTESYAPGSVVVDPHGVTYLAQQEVPAGTSLSNRSNWQSLDAIAPTVAPPTSVPSVTPNTGTVPNQLPNQTLEAGPVAQAQASSSKDHNQSDECCAGEDLHKEDHQKAGPRPNQPNGPGYVDYKLEWEKAKKDLVGLNQRIAEEGERQRKQQEEIASLEKSILSKREETSRVQSDWDNCIAMGKKLLAELEGKRNSLAGLDARVTGLVSERKSIESEITACLLLVKESTEEFERLEQEHQPVVNKLAVPHLKGWHYEAEHGWLYVEIGSFPYVFSQRMDSWLYYKQGSHHPWQYFDYQRQAWNLWQ